jgi:hypothetical protein
LFEVLALGVGTMFTGSSLTGTVIVIIVLPELPVPGPGVTGTGARSRGNGLEGTGGVVPVFTPGLTGVGPVFNGPSVVVVVNGTGTGVGLNTVIKTPFCFYLYLPVAKYLVR